MMRTVVTQWKSYTAKTLGAAGVRWQRGFFDHRLRCDESLDAKSSYIRTNPVRAGLVARAEEWPWVYAAGDADAGPGGPGATSGGTTSGMTGDRDWSG